MAPLAKDQIVKKIEGFRLKVGGTWRVWYVGITNDIKRRLLKEHNVSKDYIYEEAYSKAVAGEIESYFHELGAQGDTGGGDEDSRFVYAYKITKDTVQ